MIKFILFFLIVVVNTNSQAQITATTSTGKTVILSSDGTWKYSNSSSTQEQQTGCEQAQTGNVTVINNATRDIYFYYAANERSTAGLKMVKIKSGATKLIRDVSLYSGRGGMYDWKAVFELANSEITLSEMQGIANGTFTVVQCGNKEVEVDD